MLKLKAGIKYKLYTSSQNIFVRYMYLMNDRAVLSLRIDQLFQNYKDLTLFCNFTVCVSKMVPRLL